MINNLKLLALLLICFNLFSMSESVAAIGNKNAPKKGTFYYNLGSGPPTLNPLSATDHYASIVQGYALESLLGRDYNTYNWVPSLAKSWETSKDGKEFTFVIREGVKWHDGKPLTVEDVKFSFDAITDKDNKYRTAHMKPYYESIKEVQIIDKNTVKFIVKSAYFRNFDTAAGMTIVPKHIYENPSKKQKKKLNKTLVGTGPYTLSKFVRGRKIILKKNKNWWGNKVEHLKGIYNFNKIFMKFVKDDTIAIEMTKKGSLDFIGLTIEDYVKKTKGSEWGKKVFKVKTENKQPKGYSFIGWNLKKPLFQNKNHRKALYHLVDRDLMIKKFQFGMVDPAAGPWYKQSIYSNPDVKPITFDPKLALSILRKEGWEDTDGDLILDKVINGVKTPFSFTILEPRKEFEKYLTIFKEDAKKVGVEVKIKLVEWSTFLKLLDEKKFDAVRLAWSGGSVDIDPKQVWHSASAGPGGSNFISYKSPVVDKLIDEARLIMDRQTRVKKLKEVYKVIANDYPYVFFFNNKYSTYAHTKKMKKEKDTYTYSVGFDYWWIEK